MKSQIKMDEYRRKRRKKVASACIYLCLLTFVLFSVACSELEKTEPQPFYAETAPPAKKEFRWSNGKMPKSFDPALASAPPETDVVRAIYEGLTDVNPKNLETISAVAIDWASSEDNKVWTFKLRRDAKWSNGEHITAQDFVRSWNRLREMGDKVSHYKLLGNIVGMQVSVEREKPAKDLKVSEGLDLFSRKTANQDIPPIFPKTGNNSNTNQKSDFQSVVQSKQAEAEKKNIPKEIVKEETGIAEKKEDTKAAQFGVEAIDNYTLKVSLVKADKEFPALVSNPIFRPIYGDGRNFEGQNLNADIVTNGAFRVFSVGQDGITLDRAEYYWNNKEIELERVRFVPTENAEKALEAYRAGDVDVVTNADFEPLALKLLTPYDDFERTTHSALNFYEFNQINQPFQDRRVREALAIGFERERITEDIMDGASRPAMSFSPFNENAKLKLSQNTEKAKTLLSQAGFPDGENFPTVKLLVNRNNIQQRIARSVAKMWKDNLNIETEITVKESGELDAVKNSGEFDLIRRGVVFPTTDETANMLATFSKDNLIEPKPIDESSKLKDSANTEKPKINSNLPQPEVNDSLPKSEKAETENAASEVNTNVTDYANILTESDALYEIPAIPLYFPTSYSLVKPYILGFEINNLDAPSLKNVRIDNNWQPKKSKNES